MKIDGYGTPADAWHYQASLAHQTEFYDHNNQQPLKITPSMSSLEALLSKLPSVVPPPTHALVQSHHHHQFVSSSQRPMEFLGMERVTKEEEVEDQEDQDYRPERDDHVGESSSSMSAAAYRHQQQHHHFHHHHDQNVASNGTNNGF